MRAATTPSAVATMTSYRGLFYTRALAFGAAVFAGAGVIVSVLLPFGVVTWQGPAVAWGLAALWAGLCFSSARTYRRSQYRLRGMERTHQRLMRDIRGSNVVRLYDPPSAEALVRGWERS